MSNKEIVALLVDKYGLKKNFLYDLVCKNVWLIFTFCPRVIKKCLFI
jgi:hypothetical protein